MASHNANTNLRDKGGNHNDRMVWKQGSLQHSSCLQEQHLYEGWLVPDSGENRKKKTWRGRNWRRQAREHHCRMIRNACIQCLRRLRKYNLIIRLHYHWLLCCLRSWLILRIELQVMETASFSIFQVFMICYEQWQSHLSTNYVVTKYLRTKLKFDESFWNGQRHKQLSRYTSGVLDDKLEIIYPTTTLCAYNCCSDTLLENRGNKKHTYSSRGFSATSDWKKMVIPISNSPHPASESSNGGPSTVLVGLLKLGWSWNTTLFITTPRSSLFAPRT